MQSVVHVVVWGEGKKREREWESGTKPGYCVGVKQWYRHWRTVRDSSRYTGIYFSVKNTAFNWWLSWATNTTTIIATTDIPHLKVHLCMVPVLCWFDFLRNPFFVPPLSHANTHKHNTHTPQATHWIEWPLSGRFNWHHYHWSQQKNCFSLNVAHIITLFHFQSNT